MIDTILKGVESYPVAHAAIDTMSDHSVPPTPENYEVWLHHRLGLNPELSRAIELRLAAGAPFDETFNSELFERFFSNMQLSAQILETGNRIAKELNEVVQTLHQAQESTSTYGDKLVGASYELNSAIDIVRLRAIVDGLAAATNEMVHQNRALSERLAVSSEQMEAMRETIRQVRAEALTDALTGLANRKWFDETLASRAEESRSTGIPMCLILVDIDHFKSFNDTWGHQTGDQIIRFIASTLQRHCQSDQLASRYGGEEFALVLPRTNLAGARALAETIRIAIEAKRLLRRSTGEDLGTVTVSIGVAELGAKEDPAQLIARADACLYASKRGGRNRVTVDQSVTRAA